MNKQKSISVKLFAVCFLSFRQMKVITWCLLMIAILSNFPRIYAEESPQKLKRFIASREETLRATVANVSFNLKFHKCIEYSAFHFTQYPPFIISLHQQQSSGNVSYQGYSMDILYWLTQRFGLKYEKLYHISVGNARKIIIINVSQLNCDCYHPTGSRQSRRIAGCTERGFFTGVIHIF